MRTLLLLLLLLQSAPVIHAQSRPAPFESLSISAGVAAKLADGGFSGLWGNSAAAQATVETPFYLGRALIGGSGAAHMAVADNTVDFYSVHTYVGWGNVWRVQRGVFLRVYAISGVYNMVFPQEESSTAADEREITFGARAAFSVVTGDHWQIQSGVQAYRVFTRTPLNIAYGFVAVQRDLTAPVWLRNLLR